MLGFLYVNKHKKEYKTHSRVNTTNLTGNLCKIGKDKIIHTVENIVLN